MEHILDTKVGLLKKTSLAKGKVGTIQRSFKVLAHLLGSKLEPSNSQRVEQSGGALLGQLAVAVRIRVLKRLRDSHPGTKDRSRPVTEELQESSQPFQKVGKFSNVLLPEVARPPTIPRV